MNRTSAFLLLALLAPAPAVAEILGANPSRAVQKRR